MSKQSTERPWVSMQDALQKLHDNDRGQPRQEFIILGAGIAGLVAAYELTQLGHKVKIYEGSERIGGRIWTKRFKNGSFHERGAMRIPRTHDYTYHYMQKVAKLELVAFATSSAEGFFNIRGKIAKTKESGFNETILPEFKALNTAEQAILNRSWNDNGGPGGLLKHYMKPLFDSLTFDDRRDLLEGKFTQPKLAALDRISWHEYFKRHSGISDDGLELLGKALTIRAPWNWSLAAILRNELNQGIGPGDQDMCAIKDGFDKLSEKVASLLPADTIDLKAKVVGIDVRARKIAMAGGNIVDFQGKNLLCTIPFSILKDLRLAGFKQTKVDAIKGMGSDYASMTKIMFSYANRFWEKEGIKRSGRSVSEDSILQSYYPFPAGQQPSCSRREDAKQSTGDSGMFSEYVGDSPEVIAARGVELARMSAPDKPTPGVLIASYTNAELSEAFCAMRPGEPTAVAMRQLKKFHPDIPIPDETDEWCWDKQEFYKGGLAISKPLTLSKYFEDAKKPEGGIHFAGEHVSIAPGWIQGSLESALRELAEMVKLR